MYNNHSIFFRALLKLLAGLICTGAGLHAQPSKTDSLHALRDNRIFDQYSFTNNAAAISENYQPGYGYAKATAGLISGDFRRPMQPSGSSIVSLSTGGRKKIGRWSLSADFEYRKVYDKDVDWAAVNDPYDGNPFIWVDSTSGRWDRDHIHATVGAATELGQLLKAGLFIDYSIGTGARTSEPKPFYRMRDISLHPGFIWQLSATEDIGLSASIGFVQEENEIGFYSNSNVLLYRLRGYGTFSKSPFVSGERKRKGTLMKGSLQYQKRWERYNLAICGSAAQRHEEVFEGVARTQTTGYFTGIDYAGKLWLYTGTAMTGKALDISYENQNGYADDMIFRAESASFIRHSILACLSSWKQRNEHTGQMQWSLLPSLTYVDYADQGAFMQFSATTLGGMIELNYRNYIGKKMKVQVRPAAGYYHALDHYFTTRAQHVIVRQLIVPDYHFFSASFLKAACRLELEINSNRSEQNHLIALQADMRLPGQKNLSNRTFFQIQYSILF